MTVAETPRDRQIAEALAEYRDPREQQLEKFEALVDKLGPEKAILVGSHAWAARCLVFSQKQAAGVPASPDTWRKMGIPIHRIVEDVELLLGGDTPVFSEIEDALGKLESAGLVIAAAQGSGHPTLYTWKPDWVV